MIGCRFALCTAFPTGAARPALQPTRSFAPGGVSTIGARRLEPAVAFAPCSGEPNSLFSRANFPATLRPSDCRFISICRCFMVLLSDATGQNLPYFPVDSLLAGN